MTNEKKEKITNCELDQTGRLKMLVSILLFVFIDVGIFVALFYTGNSDFPFMWILSQFVIVFILPFFVNLFLLTKVWVKTGKFIPYLDIFDKIEFIKKYLFGDWRK